MTNRFGTSDDWEDGDVLNAADLLDTFDAIRYHDFVGVAALTANSVTSVVAHSSTNYTVLMDNGTILNSTNSGASWTSKSTVLDTNSLMIGGRTDKTILFGIELGTTNETVFSTNSGATVSAATSAAFGTNMTDASMPAEGLIVVVGDDSGGSDHVVFSTDQFSTVTNATTQPSAPVVAVGMFDTSTGYLVDTSGNIWKTTNGAVDWTDTTDNVTTTSPNDQTKVYAISATLVIIANGGLIDIYNNSTNTVTVRAHAVGADSCQGIIETANGNIYVAMDSSGNANETTLLRTTDNGTSWSQTSVAGLEGSSGTIFYKNSFSEKDNNNLIFQSGRVLIDFRTGD